MIISFVSVGAMGQSFMDWSFHYLHGAKSFWNFDQGPLAVTENPVNKLNAHGHRKNHPCDEKEITLFLEKAKSIDFDIITFYPFFEDHHDDILLEYKKLAKMQNREKIKQFWIKPTRPYPYFFERSQRDKTKEIDSVKRWLKIDHDDMKTIRELMSFKLPGNRLRWLANVDRFHKEVDNHIDLTVTDVEWQYETESCMIKIFEKLNLAIDETRLPHWREVANTWRGKLEKFVEWYEKDAPWIANMIVDNKDFDLTPFNLNYLKEAIIMSIIMKNYGRRLILPTLEFPKNAKDLHRLLK